MKCNNCNHENNSTSKFCENCGKELIIKKQKNLKDYLKSKYSITKAILLTVLALFIFFIGEESEIAGTIIAIGIVAFLIINTIFTMLSNVESDFKSYLGYIVAAVIEFLAAMIIICLLYIFFSNDYYAPLVLVILLPIYMIAYIPATAVVEGILYLIYRSTRKK